MKDKIINAIVVAVMVVIANYPMYKSMQATVGEIDIILQTVQAEIISWQRDINEVQVKIERVRDELVGTVNSGIAQTDSVLNKIKNLENEARLLNNKIDSLKVQTIDKVKEKIDIKKIDIEKFLDFKG